MVPSIGSSVGPYEILAPLGSGGMGDVFRARDTRIDRPVAVKLLPREWAQDPDRLWRFEQEARAVGSLTHPNLLTLFDLGTAEGVPYLVTELLEGETLRERLQAGRLPTRKAVDIAAQAARGLAAAHERGVVHRDVKPENIFVTRDGRVKLLDFGLARFGPAPEPATAEGETRIVTQAGTVLGTPGYLSPEQARGQAVDARSDIFSLGVVLYEMLAGRRAFTGDTPFDAITAVVQADPPELPVSDVPGPLAAIVRRCLEKSPAERYHSAQDVAFSLEAAMSGSVSGSGVVHLADVVAPAGRPSWFLLGGVAVAALAAGFGLAWFTARPSEVETPVLQYEAWSGRDSAPAASPEGRTLAFMSSRDGTPRIWLKQLAGGSEAPLTAGPDNYPRFHPDGGSILFIRREGPGTALFRQAIVGGEPRRLLANADDADWSPDGRRIVAVRRSGGGSPATTLLLLGADGSDVRELAHVEGALAQARWSPDGNLIASVEFGLQSGSHRHVVITSVADGSTRRLRTPLQLRRLSSPAWLAGGREIAFGQAESVVADTTGSAARVFVQDIRTGAARLLFWTPVNPEVLDVLADGSLVWDGAHSRANMRLVPLGGDARGERWLSRGQSIDRQPIVTPGGERVIFVSNRSGNLDLWAVAPATGTVTRLTDHPADDWDPALTHDGRLIWSSARSGHFEIWIAHADGSEARQLSDDGVDAENPTATPDGWVVYSSSNPEKRGIWKVREDGTAAVRVTSDAVLVPDVSPDGQYVAATTQSETSTVRIRVWRLSDGARVPFEIGLPGDDLRFAVGRCRWMPGGKALAFIAPGEDGVRSIFVQDFVPGQDTTATRRPIGAFDANARADSFGISPDGRELVVSEAEELRTILRADGVRHIVRPAAGR